MSDEQQQRRRKSSEVRAVNGQFLKDIYQRYAGELVGFLRKALHGSDADADDIAQTTFMKIAALPEPGGIKDPRAFLYATAKNAMIDYARQNQRRQLSLDRMALDLANEQPADISPENMLIERERLQILEAAIAGMPARRRRVFILSRIHHMSYAEIAAETGLTREGVKKHISRALADCEAALVVAVGMPKSANSQRRAEK